VPLSRRSAALLHKGCGARLQSPTLFNLVNDRHIELSPLICAPKQLDAAPRRSPPGPVSGARDVP
jgi:hypothetical protein